MDKSSKGAFKLGRSLSGVPVIVGLAVGIAFMVLIALAFKPNLSPTDEQIITYANNFPEAKVFLSQYPQAKVEVDRTGSYGAKPLVVYRYEKTYEDGRIDEARMFVGLKLLSGMPSRIAISTDCGVSYVGSLGGISYSLSGRSVIEALQKTQCAK